ncbi:hypothetical protein H5410_055801 [Solanum commersonii]|uniref:Uncharacterized protein n=1 Tax=Solanum commersonii TaxID=4109 RepID=A0A9J5WIJ2_SOLCO|nr:hypothetical protein H5410_055801 [Solanum commersonii]
MENLLSHFQWRKRQDFMIEEGLHQAVMFKLSYGALDLKLLIFSTMKKSTNVGGFSGIRYSYGVLWLRMKGSQPSHYNP